MDANPLHGKSLALEPIEDSTLDAEAQRDLHITTADEFLAAAAREYQEGVIDQALWRQAADQRGSDASLVIAAYLRARATALKLQQKQDERPQRQARRAGSAGGASDRRVESEPPLESGSTAIAAARPRGVQPGLKYLAAGAAALASVVTVVWLIASPRESESVRPPVVSAAVPAPSRPAPRTPLGSNQAVVAATNQGGLEPAVETRMQELKKAGNWNVFVLYASDWTRKEPKNAAAWHQLSVGYANLRQLGDALDAAKKAVQLGPEDALLWRNLGHVNLTVERLPDAGIAFDRALALSPDDPDALCGAALVAQRQGRSNDADALARRVKSADGACRGVSDAASAASVASGSTTHKPVPSVSR
jgi:tetratricopeptide (TPR) repeat protein